MGSMLIDIRTFISNGKLKRLEHLNKENIVIVKQIEFYK